MTQRKLLTLCCLVLVATTAMAQQVTDTLAADIRNPQADYAIGGTIVQVAPPAGGEEWLRKEISSWGELQNGCLNSTAEEGVMLHDLYGYCFTGDVNDDLKNQLAQIGANKWPIADVNILDNGKFIIVYGRNGYWQWGCPPDMATRLKALSDAGEVFRSACFNIHKRWCIVTDSQCVGDSLTQAFALEAERRYGQLYSVYITSKSKIACCERGVYCEKVPSTVYEALLSQPFKPRYIKFTNKGHYIMTDGQKAYWYLF